MPDPITPNPVAPGQEPSVAPPAPAEPTSPQQAARAAITERYQQMYQQEPPQAPPTPEPPATPPAPAPAPTEPSVNNETIQVLLDRIAALENAQKPQAPPPPAAPEATADWVDLLVSGKKAEAEAALRAQLAVPDASQVITQAVEQMRAEQELNNFMVEVRTANADIASMEPFVAALAERELQQVLSQKPQASPAERVAAYKTAVNNAITSARNTILEFRGQGAQQASTRQTQVLAQPTLVPTPVNTNRETPTSPEAPESATDYVAKRQQWSARGRGLTLNS